MVLAAARRGDDDGRHLPPPPAAAAAGRAPRGGVHPGGRLRLAAPPAHASALDRVDSGASTHSAAGRRGAVTLTESAKAFLGLDDGSAARELTFDEIREATTACDDEAIDAILDARPMADQRGETVVLDAEQGQLRWIKEVAWAVARTGFNVYYKPRYDRTSLPPRGAAPAEGEVAHLA